MADRKQSESADRAAYRALEEALRLEAADAQQTRPNAEKAPSSAEANVSETPKQRASEPQQRPRDAETARPAASDNMARNPALEAANDASRRNPAAILKSLEAGSLRSALGNALLISVFWIIGGVGLAQLLFGDQISQASSVAGLVAAPGVLAIAIGIIVPVLLFFAFAILMARAHDMRNAARSMAEVALRLAEPETVASERIMTVGQAVRREVSALNEGIERTIARATELETLVHSEVNAL